jgi:hypothetical protein
MARFDGFRLDPAEKSQAHNEDGDWQDDGLPELHDDSLHN